MDKCFICLKNEHDLTRVNSDSTDSENHIIIKLKNFVPELVSSNKKIMFHWQEEFRGLAFLNNLKEFIWKSKI